MASLRGFAALASPGARRASARRSPVAVLAQLPSRARGARAEMCKGRLVAAGATRLPAARDLRIELPVVVDLA